MHGVCVCVCVCVCVLFVLWGYLYICPCNRFFRRIARCYVIGCLVYFFNSDVAARSAGSNKLRPCSPRNASGANEQGSSASAVTCCIDVMSFSLQHLKIIFACVKTNGLPRLLVYTEEKKNAGSRCRFCWWWWCWWFTSLPDPHTHAHTHAHTHTHTRTKAYSPSLSP